ncbi:MAG: hypothetical protein LBT75_04625 [Bacilli bacterium]|jgi:hypothetical protein|nr:hypothetical protein [Bacilli bacterium]
MDLKTKKIIFLLDFIFIVIANLVIFFFNLPILSLVIVYAIAFGVLNYVKKL